MIESFLKKVSAVSKRHIVNCFVLSIVLNMAVEAISRKSFLLLFEYIFSRPYVFFYNSLIILLTLLPVLFIRRKTFYYAIVSVVWLGAGIINSIILIFRTTPFTASDLLLIKSAINVLNKYLTVKQIWIFGIILGIVVCLVIALVVRLFIKAHKYTDKIFYVKYSILYASVIVIFILATKLGLATNQLSERFGNIADAFKTYGFAYCFTNSIVNTGIDKPEDYSEEMVLEILYDIEQNFEHENVHVVSTKKDINIIFVQLESFFDVKYLENITFSENPTPIFKMLKENYSSGFLRVPSIGAGTANTEFEIITGMNIDFFGPGEYPYKTVLQDNVCESFPFVLKNEGYATHAIHNNVANFYDRNIVFKNLGFDTFTSLEYMNATEFTPNGWAKDFYLTNAIVDCLISTEKTPDYIYAISVQAHGKYPEEINPDEYSIHAYDEFGVISPEYTYYANQLREVDMFIGGLVDTLSSFSEKTVVVFYGDHLPNLGISNETLKNGDIFQTEYVIWSNYPMKHSNENLEAYQIGSKLMTMLGVDSGILSVYHRFYSNEDDYLDKLQVIQYDMLYGKNGIYEGLSPYMPTDMRMGVKDIVIEDVIIEANGDIYVKGKNFNNYSIVIIDDDDYETEFIDTETLKVVIEDVDELEKLETVVVGQGELNITKLSLSNIYVLEELDE